MIENRKSSELRKTFRSAQASKFLSKHHLTPEGIDRYLDARDTFDTATIVSTPPNVKEPDFPIVGANTDPKTRRTVNDSNFEADMSAALSGLGVAGYSMRVRRRGETVFTLNGGSARISPDSDAKNWDTTIKMHVASVSKLVTSMAVTKLLLDKGIDVDTSITNFLPRHFRVAPTSRQITLRHLLTMTSGFRQIQYGGLNDGYTYYDFKQYVERGVDPANFGQWSYHNGNFIGLRIAMAVMSGMIDPNAEFGVPEDPDAHDTLWDALSVDDYVKYVSRNILRPASVTAKIHPADEDSLAYSASLRAPGWKADPWLGAGTDAWWFSVDEILSIMSAYWDGDGIVRKSASHQALRYNFGLDDTKEWQLSDGVQDCFMKSGYWSDGMSRTQQCSVTFAPNDTLIAVFVNSPIASTNIPSIVERHLQANIS